MNAAYAGFGFILVLAALASGSKRLPVAIFFQLRKKVTFFVFFVSHR
jgi:hypothetical protein